MPLDAICLSALTSELSEKLTGGRIDKVQQPERDMLLLSRALPRVEIRACSFRRGGEREATFDGEHPLKTPPSRRCSVCCCASI